MKQAAITLIPDFITGMRFTIPAACLIMISVLNFQSDYPSPYDTARPFLQSAGISEPHSLNINLLLLFAPVLALLISLLAKPGLRFDSGKDRIDSQCSTAKRWWNLLSILSSLVTLVMIAGYFFVEHCEW